MDENNNINIEDIVNEPLDIDVERKARKKPKKRKRGGFNKRGFILLLIIVIAIIAAFIFINRGKDVDMKESNVLMNKEYELNSKSDFYTYGSNIYHATKDSLSLVDQKGKEVWVDSYTMISPVLVGDKNIVAAAEKNGNNIRVYNEGGLMYNVTFNEPVTTFAVNGTGCLGVIKKMDSNYELAVYNNGGEKVYGGNYVARDGIPMSIDISDDGAMFAVSFMNITNIKMQANVLFYYIDSAKTNGAQESNGMFTSVVCEDCMPFMLKFVPGNKCIVLMDDRAVFIDPTAQGETQKVEHPLGNSVSYACVNGDGTLAMAMGEPLLNAAEQLEENTIIWYGANGDKVNEYKAPKNVTGLFAGEDITVIAMDRNFEAYKTKGGSLWQYTALQDTTKVLTYNGNDKMLAVTPVKAVLAKVGKGNNLIETNTQQDEAAKGKKTAEETTEPVSQAEGETKAENKTDEAVTKLEPTTAVKTEKPTAKAETTQATTAKAKAE